MIKLFRNKYWLFFLLFPFFNPNSLKYIPGLTILYNLIQVWKLFSCFVIVLCYIYRTKISKVVLSVVLLTAVSISASLLNGIYDSKVLTNALIAISLAMVTEMGIKSDFRKYYMELLKILTPLIIINMILCIIHPNGLRFASLYTNWTNPLYFLGIDNGMVSNLIPFLFLSAICLFADCGTDNIKKYSKHKNKWLFGIACTISFITIFIVQSATGLFVLVVSIGMTVAFTIVLQMKIPYIAALITYIISFFVIVLLQSNVFLTSAVTTLFGRNIGFTGRSLLWQKAIEKILKKPIVGYGYTSGNIEIWGGTFSSHNMFLEMLIQGGIIYLALFLIITFLSLRRNTHTSVKMGNLTFIAIYCFLLKGLMEVGITPFYYILLVIAYYSNLIKVQLQK